MNGAFWAQLAVQIISLLISRLSDDALKSVKTRCNVNLLKNLEKRQRSTSA